MLLLMDNKWAIPPLLLLFAWLCVNFANFLGEQWSWSAGRRRVLALLLTPVIPCFFVAPAYAIWSVVVGFEGTCASLFDSENAAACTRFEAFMVQFAEGSLLMIPVSVAVALMVLGIWGWEKIRKRPG